MEGDSTRLVQIIGNILHNSAKFMEPGGRIVLSVAQEDAHAVITVKDAGMGIPGRSRPEDLRPLLAGAPEVRARTVVSASALRSSGGSSRCTVEQSVPGQGPGHGTELVVRLPLLGVTSTSFGCPSESKRPPVVSPRRILVADDNSDAVEALALQLQLAGHDVRTANDGMRRSRSRSRLRPRWSCSILACPEWTATRPHARSGAKWWGRAPRSWR